MTEQALRTVLTQACYHSDHSACGRSAECRCGCHAPNVVIVRDWPWPEEDDE